MEHFKLNLQMFAGEEGAAGAETAAAETATAAEAAAPEATPVKAGDTLPDGTQVQNARVAAALEGQMQRHPELRQVYGKGRPAQKTQPVNEAPAEMSAEDRWNEAKKGEFAEFYGRDVQNAIRDRFKNAQDSEAAMQRLEPMLAVLRERAGVDSNDDLIAHVLDDDSLYEDAANEAGMTVEAYKEFAQAQAELDQYKQAEAEREENQRIYNHFGYLQQQAEAMRQMYPDFNLEKELQNPQFLRLTSPDVNISVEDAYYAVHHKELAPQMMAYGMQRARTQMGQTLQAQRTRPAEGAMSAQGQPAAEIRVDPRNMTRAEREEIKRQVRLGRRVSFD